MNIRHPHIHSVIDEMIDNSEICGAGQYIGRYNVILAARFHSIDLFNKFIKDKVTQIKDVQYYQTFLLAKPLKYHGVKWY